MQIIADLQIHGPYARATSKNTDFFLLEKYARIKGLNLLGCADFQHPMWNKEIKNNLREDENGILWTKTNFPFLWQTEISLIYTQDGKGRRVHHLIFSPSGEVSNQIIDALGKKGRLDYDGRPIFGFNSIELVDMMMGIAKDIEIIPAHIWTTHFSLMGDYNKYSKVEDCFKENTKYIHALETGMSSTPDMNWRISSLDKFNLVSFSDSHSFWPWRLGREATIFNVEELTYKNIINAIRTGDGLDSTIETPPEYGKYHFTGHRNCSISLNPEGAVKIKNICPVCRRPLTVGVAQRIEELADREDGYKPHNPRHFIKLIPLHELIAAFYGTNQLASKKVWDIYNKLIEQFESEFNVLLNAKKDDLVKVIDIKLIELIIKNREQKLLIDPGYDGVYGKLILEENKKDNINKQKSLGDFS